MRKNGRNGYTMIEMMVTSTLGLLLTSTLMGLLTLGREVWQDSDTKTTTLQEVRKGLSELSLDLPRASWSSPAGAVCGAGVTFGTGGSFICFRVPQTIVGQTITWGDTIRYRRVGTRLIRQNLTIGETRVVANSINSATFTPVGTPPSAYVTVAISAQKISRSTRTFQSSLQTNFSVRN